ncbi:hypothetical protein H5V45_12950 [Nocardioides sp. KIGAM211]|uniref:Uncharacterized protein n=1 Tax=Nocardioides luti TaxID=2761101 RepID=A0A7X0VAX0_9ACTN|nr:hypothetical protein [Nocardioides luti]MBB6628229.1 hypothetical protein [Nocardioides luti]
MSKMDDMRAMREANFAAAPPRTARATPPADEVPVAPPTRKAAPAKKAPAKKASKPPAAMTSATPDEGRRCGHRAISGRSCTREHGHEEKSHRYG